MKYLLESQQTDRLSFRNVSTLDFATWLPFFEDPRTHQHWVTDYKPPHVQCEEWFQRQQHRYDNGLGGMNALIEKSSGRLAGHAGLLIQTVDGVQEMEIGYSLLPEFWGKGYASEAAIKCRNYAFENNFSESLISIISLTNLPSMRVAVKNGMAADKEVIYNNNAVKIFRVTRLSWLSQLKR